MQLTEADPVGQQADVAAQQPSWPDQAALSQIIAELTVAPPLVQARECDQLLNHLAAVAQGKAFLLQGGDCAETFQDTPGHVYSKLRTFFQMAAILADSAAMPVVKVGRIAGQYAKPRSSPTETRDGVTLPAYRGDAVNGRAFTPEARIADPGRLLRMYNASAATQNLLRSCLSDGRMSTSVAHRLVTALRLGKARENATRNPDSAEFFTSHEALLLDYENALARADSATGDRYGLSGHMLWIGERTRQINGAHVAFAASVRNPVGIKLGPSATADEVIALIDRIDPQHLPGRLTLITRMGAGRVRQQLPQLVEKVMASGAPVVWVCDPMHGNTFTSSNGRKTRKFETVLDEIKGFIDVHRMLGTHPGGIHIEFTGGNVTECLGSASKLTDDDLLLRYETACDPRLNQSQALQLSFEIANTLRGYSRNGSNNLVGFR
jgi:3-deoxy-7-phosphoheptulonate synthase